MVITGFLGKRGVKGGRLGTSAFSKADLRDLATPGMKSASFGAYEW
jgi:hypothetical protein